jgi:phage tail sheath protein FI
MYRYQMSKRPSIAVTDAEQEILKTDTVTGKSINAIRHFPGKGTLLWGARTLAGNDNEWRYISVRRFFNTIEESVKKGTGTFVFEPNDANTWEKVKSDNRKLPDKSMESWRFSGCQTGTCVFCKNRIGTNHD